MKQLNFEHFKTNSKEFFETIIFFQKVAKKEGSKKANIILFSISRSFWPFYDNSGLFQKISEGYRRFPKTNEEVRPLPKMSEEPSKHLTFNSTCEWQNHRFVLTNLFSRKYFKRKKQQKWTLKYCKGNKFSKTTIAIRFNLRQVCPSVPPFVSAVLFIPSLTLKP